MDKELNKTEILTRIIYVHVLFYTDFDTFWYVLQMKGMGAGVIQTKSRLLKQS